MALALSCAPLVLRYFMKTLPALVVLLLLASFQGCSSIKPGEPAPARGLPPGSSSTMAARLDVRLPQPAASAEPPAAVIKVEPGSVALSAEMRRRLAVVARLARDDERTLLRLEGYVPDGGSPAWNIGAAERSLRLVREQLESLRVPARRIQVAAFGEEHDEQRDDRRHWIEIYVLRPRR